MTVPAIVHPLAYIQLRLAIPMCATPLTLPRVPLALVIATLGATGHKLQAAKAVKLTFAKVTFVSVRAQIVAYFQYSVTLHAVAINAVATDFPRFRSPRHCRGRPCQTTERHDNQPPYGQPVLHGRISYSHYILLIKIMRPCGLLDPVMPRPGATPPADWYSPPGGSPALPARRSTPFL